MQKRGQVTLFIILGIIIVVAVILFIAFTQTTVLSQILPDRIFPPKTGGVQGFIETCVAEVARDGIALLGAQGGYIWLPSAIENNPLSYINTGIKTPHWQYLGENRVPSLQLMESHLARYVDENAATCLEGIEDVDDEHDIVVKGDAETEVKIFDETVAFNIIYPIDVVDTDGVKISEVDKFRVDVEVKLKGMYEVAVGIMEAEANRMKFEDVTVDLIALDPAVPLTGVDFQCSRKTWKRDKVEDKLKRLLRKNLPSVRVEGTDYIPVPEDQPYVLNHYVWDVLDLKYSGISTAFTFVDNQFQMHVSPSSGNRLQANQMNGFDIASFVCMQQWNFVYDVRYPVMVSVEDVEHNTALRFGFIVNVENNRGVRDALRTGEAFTQVTSGASEEAYCNNVYGDYFMTVNTFDNVVVPGFAVTPFPINNVDISFTCLKYTCGVGKSKFESNGAIARLEAQFPYCASAIVKGKKEGYKDAAEFVTTTPGGSVDLYLTPVKTIEDYTVAKHIDGVPVTSARDIDEDENAFIILRMKDGQKTVHETSGGYPARGGVDLQALEFLAEDNFPYELEIFLMDESSIVGGYKGTWTPDWNRLQRAQSIEFHVIAVERYANDNEMAAFIAKLEENSLKVPEPVLR